MVKLISRYFSNRESAVAARKELIFLHRFSQRIMSFYDDATGAVEKLSKDGVQVETATAYGERLKEGGAVLVVRAGCKPLCVAQITRDTSAEFGAEDMGDLIQEVELQDRNTRSLSILDDHPLMLSRPRDPYATNSYMANWPIPLISRRKPFAESLFPPHSRMANWPIPLISRRKPFTGSIFAPHARMASFPIPLLSSRRPYDKFAFPRHARMADWPIPLISRRKPFSGTKIGRHTRMANWPFPLLINGKTGSNSLMPGGPRMANFPIPLLSQRKPYDASMFPRHARMANFPLLLLSKRKPYDEFAFPRHARMADIIMPLVIRNKSREEGSKRSGFSLSALLGIPTLIRR